MKTSDAARILGDIRTLSRSWAIHLRAENKESTTVTAYTYATFQLGDFLDATRIPVSVTRVTREHVEMFLIDVMECTTAATAAARFGRLQQFFRWLVEEDELTVSPMTRMKPPKVAEKQVPAIRTEDLSRLLQGCRGRDFISCRDHAILRLPNSRT